MTNSELQQEVLRESLRQCRLSFNLALGTIALSTLLAIALLFSNKSTESKIIIAVQILTSAGSVKFAKDNQAECDRLLQIVLKNSPRRSK